METPIDVDEDNQWKHDSEFVKIIKNMYGTCFISNFSREIDWEWSQICQRPLSHAHRRRQRQPGRVPQVPYMFLMILMNSLSCFHWLSSSFFLKLSSWLYTNGQYFWVPGYPENVAPDLIYFLGALRVPKSPLKNFKPNLKIYSLIF